MTTQKCIQKVYNMTDPINKGNENIKKQVPSFKQYCEFVLGKNLYKKVMSNPMPLSYGGQVSITKLYARYRKFIGKPFSSNVIDKK